MHNPNLHELDRDLSFRVVELGPGYYPETLRTVSANANLSLGRAALQAAVKQNPNGTWLLKYLGGVAGRYDPPGTKIASGGQKGPVPGWLAGTVRIRTVDCGT